MRRSSIPGPNETHRLGVDLRVNRSVVLVRRATRISDQGKPVVGRIQPIHRRFGPIRMPHEY
jgi:hypothetical protein